MPDPLISVITPVGPRHRDHVGVARASLLRQTVPPAWWEHLVEFDDRRDGPAICRNRALARARGAFVVFLDADDYLVTTALESYLRGFARAQDACYIFADNYVIGDGGAHHYSNSEEYNQAAQAYYNQHVVTALLPTALARAVGGFDEAIDLWEDWTLWLRLAMRGYCGQRIREPALVYRITEGERMLRGQALGTPPMALVQRRYADETGAIAMCGCQQPASVQAARAQASFAVQVFGAPPMAPNGLTRLVYAGAATGGFFVTSQATGQRYKLGGGRLVDAAPADVDWLMALGCAPIPAAAFTPPPAGVAVDGDLTASDVPEAAPAPASLGAAISALSDGPTAPAPDAETFTPKRLRKRGGA